MADKRAIGREVSGVGDLAGHYLRMRGGSWLAGRDLGGLSEDVVGGPTGMEEIGFDIQNCVEVWGF